MFSKQMNSAGARLKEFHVEDAREYDRRSPLRWILSHVLRYPLLPVLLVLSAAVNNGAYANIQLYIGKSFDVLAAVRGPGALSSLVFLMLVIAGSALLQGIMGLVRNYSVEYLAQRIERDCREEYYASLLEKSQTFHGRYQVGDLMARATYDVHALNLMFSPGLMLIVDSFLAYLLPMLMIARIHPALLLTPVLFSVLLAAALWDYNKRLKPVSMAQQDQYGKLSAGTEETLSGIAAVKSNVQESHEWNKFFSNARILREYFIQQGVIQARYWPMLVFSVLWGGALFHSLILWKTGSISLGMVIGFMGLFNTFRFVTYISLFSFTTVQHGLAGAERILEVITAETELDQNREGISRPIEGSVVFDTVFFSYGRTLILKRINFSAEPGSTVAIVGRTGSGKTTLTRLINRMYDPSVGSVSIDGKDLREWNLQSLRSQIAVIEQDVFLFSRSIRENIAFGRADASDEDIQHAAEQAQAHDFIMSFKDGYDTLVGDRGVTLSGGQRQRIAIARAFLTDPRILIFDDSTSAIDSKTEDDIQKAMHRISRDRTTFMITHRLSQIRWADHIIVLHGGTIADQGNHESLLARSSDYRRIFSGLSEGSDDGIYS